MTNRLRATRHPQSVLDDLFTLSEEIEIPEDLHDVLEIVAKTILPPPNPGALLSAAKVVRTHAPDHRADVETLISFLETVESEPGTYSGEEYPVFYATEKIGHVNNPGPILTIVVNRFFGRWSTSPMFKVNAYYKDILAIRDTLCRANAEEGIDLSTVRSTDDLQEHLKFLKEKFPNTPVFSNQRRKIVTTMGLLSARREIGLARRIVVTQRTRRGSVIGTKIDVPRSFVRRQQALEQDLRAEERGVEYTQRVYENSTIKDRSSRSRDLMRGFARSSVPNCSEMSCCSFVTYQEFLEFARCSASPFDYSLVWLSAIAGLDVDRPLRVVKQDGEDPKGDEILVTPSAINYHVIRRGFGKRNDEFETAGVMSLLIPDIVRHGLESHDIATGARRPSKRIYALGRKFGLAKPGLVPTARRLRASSQVHFRPLGLSELQYCAISGRVSAQLKAKSHYYCLEVRDVNDALLRAYEMACKSWPGLRDAPVISKNLRSQSYVFSKPAATAGDIRFVLESLGNQYKKCLETACQTGHLMDILRAVEVHQVAAYVLQEFGAGLRPVGDVAQLTIQSELGAMTCDKASRLFAERSFSPVSGPHLKVAVAARANRRLLSRLLAGAGVEESVKPKGAVTHDLACSYKLTQGGVARTRMTGVLARKYLRSTGMSSALPSVANWIRRSFAQAIGHIIASWAADEILGHRRVGREPTSSYSTAGVSQFENARICLEAIHHVVISEKLFEPISYSGRLWKNQH